MADRVVVIIPARYGSSRLPGKALAEIAGVPMVVCVYRRACAIPGVDAVVVATDDHRIATAVEHAGGRAVMTRPDHRTGTDRVAEAAAGFDAGVVVNVQGDLPFLDPNLVAPMVRLLGDDPGLPMATMMTPVREAKQMQDPSVIKVVVDRKGYALYFSRLPIPAGAVIRGVAPASSPDRPEAGRAATAMHHLGIYAYRRSFLSTLTSLPETPLERGEALEQLRALEHGYSIGVAQWAGAPVLEVNTPADLERARSLAATEESAGGGGRRAPIGKTEPATGAARP